MPTLSPLHQARAAFKPALPAVFKKHGAQVKAAAGETPLPATDREALQRLFPHTYGLPAIAFKGATSPAAAAAPLRVGVILSGGQAPGGHNVIAGLFDGLKSLHAESQLIGFLGGPAGPIKGKYKELDAATVDAYRNTGGFDIIGSGRDKIETAEDIAAVKATCAKLGLKALVVIGGDDSNTNACLLAEHYWGDLQVIGCPKTIDGDLKNDAIETSFGFDTACKVYSELIGNIQRDALSAKKYWHFIKLMGRSASHIALECALQTHPNYTFISEEVAAKKQTLSAVVDDLAKVIAERGNAGKNYGVVLIPEGLIEFIPEIKALISELNKLLAKGGDEAAQKFASATSTDALVALGLTAASAAAYLSLPGTIRRQLVLQRDSHGNVPVSQIETERLLIDLVTDRLKALKTAGSYTGKFAALSHFFGYEGRCAQPSNFDANYCYALGYTAAALLGAGKSGYIASVRGLDRTAKSWTAGGVPLTSMMNMETRKGESKPVIRKALVELEGKPYLTFAAGRAAWAKTDDYVFPGPIQYFGPTSVCDLPTQTLTLEHQ
jgi:pyrophosphate--fructose-6-phosphate 1-phosphotransferase